jgi:hypothetical protein
MPERPATPVRVVVVGVTILVAFAVGWFFLSWQVIGTPAANAFGEAIGAAFGLLIVVSAAGAIRSRRRENE